MKAVDNISGGSWIGLLVSLVVGDAVFAQAGKELSCVPGAFAVLTAYGQQRRTPAQEQQTLLTLGDAPEQLEAWRQRYAGRHNQSGELAQDFSGSTLNRERNKQ
jgi:hypothetical protein